MDEHTQLDAFETELNRLIDRYAEEFDVSAMAVCGILMMKIREIQDDLMQREEEGKP